MSSDDLGTADGGTGPDSDPGPAKPKRPNRPVFAKGYPTDPTLEPLILAFARGDYAAVNLGVGALATHTDDPIVLAAAADLAARTRPSVASTLLWGFGIALAVFLYAFYVSKGHP